MKTAKCLLTAILMIYFGVALAASSIGNLVDVTVPTNIDGSTPDLEQVKNAIIAGCKSKGWAPLVDEDGNISCSILVWAQHYAEVSIPYTASSYSVLYKDSRELKYNEKKQTIHRNYNKWVILLSDNIQKELLAGN